MKVEVNKDIELKVKMNADEANALICVLNERLESDEVMNNDTYNVCSAIISALSN